MIENDCLIRRMIFSIFFKGLCVNGSKYQKTSKRFNSFPIIFRIYII